MHAQKEISDQLSHLVEKMTPSQNLPDKSADTPTTLKSGNGDISAFCSSVDSRLSPVGTSRLSEDRLDQETNSVQTLSPITIKQQCKALCRCVCHTRSIVKLPWILGVIIGRIDIQYIGTRPPCNELHCHPSPETWFKVVYQLPEYIINRYLSMIVQYGHTGGPEFLLRVPRVVPWSHLLWNYTIKGDLLAIQKLFAEGKASPYDLNPRGSSALFYIGNRDPLRTFRYLSEQGTDMDHPNMTGTTASDILCEYYFAGNSGSEGTSVDGSMLGGSGHLQTRGFSTLHKILLGLSHDDLESELESSTAEINVGDSRMMTPLFLATMRNDLQAVKTLLTYGADPNVVDALGRTPLFFAGSTDICKLLLDAGVNIHTPKSALGRSALHQRYTLSSRWCLESDTVDIIDMLVKAGIGVDVRDSDGQTPLLAAIYVGYISHTRRLLELGANPNLHNQSSHHSAIHFAVLFDRHDVIPLLLKYGADYTALGTGGMDIAHMAAWSASTKTVSVLADSNLVNLDLSLRCNDGKTPADYLSERSVLTENERGLHAEFQRFTKSIPASGVHIADGISAVGTVQASSDECDNLYLPGAYPVFPESNTPL